MITEVLADKAAGASARRRNDAWELSEEVAQAWGRRKGCIIRLPARGRSSLPGLVCLVQRGTVGCLATEAPSEIIGEEAQG